MKSTLGLTFLTILSLAGCSSGAQPAASFEKDGTRVFESYDLSGNVTKKVTIPAGTMSLRLKMDCINDSGDIKVEAATGWGDLPCGKESNGQGYIGLSAVKGKPFDRNQTIKVTAPAEARWSVAVDALDTPEMD
jgi:hypothetical protein